MKKRKGWTKERLEKFRATMKAKWADRDGQVNGQPLVIDSVIAKWTREADAAFSVLPFEKKVVLLGWLEKR